MKGTHPPYVAIWVLLIALLLVSLGFGFLGNKTLAAALIFGVAAAKAFLVLAYYMHLKLEPRFVALIVAGGLACVLVLGGLLIPDIVYGV